LANDGSQGIAASRGNHFGTREAHHVGISPQEDRGGAAGKVGEGTGGEEGGVAVLVASPVLFQIDCRTPRKIDLAN
jgi:hypothetical protein